jgi:hypothetical protein
MRGGGADEIGAERGMPAGGVGVTAGVDDCGIDAIVLATPIVLAPIGFACGATAGTFEGLPPGAVIGWAALRTDAGAAPGADGDKRCPQCWQKAKPTGVPLPHAGQIALAACAVGLAAGDATGASVAATVAATPAAADAAGLAMSEVPHILQKFMPGGFTVPHALHVVPPAAADFGAGAASRRWPQSWQNSDPSRLIFPQCEQRGIARVTSRVKGDSS